METVHAPCSKLQLRAWRSVLLFTQQHSRKLTKILSEVLFKRWSIETNIALQKNILQLESFSGLTPLSVKQDFYATVFIANLHSILIKDAQAAVDNNTATRKHPAKINRNKSHGKLRSHLVELFTCHQPEEILKLLHGYFIRNPIPVRHGRTFARIVKNKQSKSKHKTYMNYKPAF